MVVKTVTDSPFLIGITSAVAILPVTFQFIYGPIIDRYSKRKILYFAMIGQSIIVGVISIVYFIHLLWLPLLLFMMFISFLLSEITFPTESSLIEVLSPREKLTKINSIFEFCYQSLDIICNGISGILVLFIGVGFIYVSNSCLLFFVGLIFLVYLKVPKTKKESERSTNDFLQQYKVDFIQGFQIVKEQTILLNIVFGVIGMNVMATMGIAMLPVISKTSAQYGFWLTAMSIGTLLGTLLANKVEKFPLNLVMPIISLFTGVVWVMSTLLVNKLIFATILFGIAWIGIGILNIYVQTLIQVNLPEEYIGLGFSFISSILGSLSPIGYFIGGLMGGLTSGKIILFISGLGYLGFTVYFLLNPKLNSLKNQLNKRFERSND
ncbi:MFS transporter [Pullulanibacillus sp. KACC 23026]|uniref:MFS transporter n=1 Tax=Pullulanibacillus sp. KACC 23026 TaxID=3028315 RepID=UPI0023AEA13A|nr:MFS transporter [Pullulanibacillus sp. KACC 23026]WEG12112.1 MFS transporter [Pullulanibacillus sp. KACC 23026]